MGGGRGAGEETGERGLQPHCQVQRQGGSLSPIPGTKVQRKSEGRYLRTYIIKKQTNTHAHLHVHQGFF